jgi:hypothetical protein
MKTYIALLAGRGGRQAAVRVNAANITEAKAAAKKAVPSHTLGGAMVYTGVTVKPESWFTFDFTKFEDRAGNTWVDLTVEA